MWDGRRGKDAAPYMAPPFEGADSPCQGEMSRSDRGAREMSQRDKRGRDRQAPRKTHLCRAGACPRRWFCVVLPVFSVGAAPCGRPLPFDTMDVGRDHWARRPQGRVPDPPEVICPTPLSSYLLTSFDLRRGGLWPPAHSTLAFFTVGADTPVPLRGNSPSVLIGPYVLFWGISPPAGGE